MHLRLVDGVSTLPLAVAQVHHTDKRNMSNSDKEDDAAQGAEKAALIDKPSKEPVQLVVFLRDRGGIYFHLEDGHQARADEILQLVMEEHDLPPEARHVFCLWFVSPILDLRLKSQHQPFQIVQQWDQLCALYTDASNEEIRDSEPVLMVQRDVFFPKDQVCAWSLKLNQVLNVFSQLHALRCRQISRDQV